MGVDTLLGFFLPLVVRMTALYAVFISAFEGYCGDCSFSSPAA